MNLIRFSLFAIVSSSILIGCGKKKSDDDTPEKVKDPVVTANALAIGYPEGLSLSAFPKSSAGTTLRLEDSSEKGQSLEEKRSDAKKVLAGDVKDCFQNSTARDKLALPSGETCYEFDQEMIYGWRDNANRTFGTKTGLSSKEGSVEVCMVSFARDEIKEIEKMIDQALDRAQIMACLAKKAGKPALEKVGDKIDLKAEINSKRPAGGSAPTFDAVTLERIADVSGKPVFQTKISTSKGAQSDEVVILHSPNSDSDNSVYSGVISIKRTGGPAGGGGAGPVGEASLVQALSIEYGKAKDAAGKITLKASVRRARFSANYATLFDANGRVNFADLPEEASNADVSGIGLVEFDMAQDEGTGTLSYWRNPGGRYTESARGFVFKIEKDDAGLLKGCSVSGAARDLSVRKALTDGTTIKPSGWYHPFFYIGASDTNAPDTGFDYGVSGGGSMQNRTGQWSKPSLADQTLAATYVTVQQGGHVSRQCFKQDGEGNYAIDTGAGIGGTAGYELIQVTDSKFISPPELAGIKGKKLKK